MTEALNQDEISVARQEVIPLISELTVHIQSTGTAKLKIALRILRRGKVNVIVAQGMTKKILTVFL